MQQEALLTVSYQEVFLFAEGAGLWLCLVVPDKTEGKHCWAAWVLMGHVSPVTEIILETDTLIYVTHS